MIKAIEDQVLRDSPRGTARTDLVGQAGAEPCEVVGSENTTPELNMSKSKFVVINFSSSQLFFFQNSTFKVLFLFNHYFIFIILKISVYTHSEFT